MSVVRAAAIVMALALPFTAFADSVGKAVGGGNSLDFQLGISGHQSIELRVSAPDGEIYSMTFENGKPVSVRLKDLGATPTDGAYTYEMIVSPRISPAVARKLESARAANDEAAARKIMRENGIASAVTQSGTFTVLSGSILNPEARESTASSVNEEASLRDRESAPAQSTSRTATPKVGVNDQVIADDLIVTGSECVGFDCVDGESFGFDTIKMKENNLRIKAEDTSTGTGFPTTDWQLTFNDSASGGANKFSVDDVTAVTTPFTITGAAPTNSVFVGSNGKVGFRTATPVLDLHVSTSDTPAHRLEQTNAGGFTAQTWDVAGNEANFFVRDVTGGSRLPFRIRPGAPTSSIDISNDGDIGIGTASPSELLHAFANEDANTFLLTENPNATGLSAAAVVRAKGDTAAVNFIAHGTARTISRWGVTLGAWTELLGVTGNGLAIGTASTTPLILGTNNVNRLHITSAGDVGINCNAPTFDLVIASGTGCSTPSSSINAGSTSFTAASSRTFKENLEAVSMDNVLDKIGEVGVYKYDFINGPKDRLGLMAEDFHTIFGRGDEKFIDGQDIQMALWLAVQKLAAQNKELTERLAKIEGTVAQ
ncbi:MAG TPA: tail fiber domain-containing protein [Thermoanaerobaculia bacterium]